MVAVDIGETEIGVVVVVDMIGMTNQEMSTGTCFYLLKIRLINYGWFGL